MEKLSELYDFITASAVLSAVILVVILLVTGFSGGLYFCAWQNVCCRYLLT